MTKNTTPLDLIRYLYKETSICESETIAIDVSNDKKLEAEFDDFVDMKSHLDQIKMSPRQSVIDRIINLAK